MTLLQLIQEFCGRQKQPVPTTVLGSADSGVVQMMRLLEESCIDISKRGAWQGLVTEATWSTTNTEDQGTIDTLAPNGFNYILAQTLWDRTQKIPLWGPTTPRTWQLYKAIVITGPQYSFRMRGNHFLVTPAPPAGHTWAFEYVSKNWVWLHGSGMNYAARFANDDDTILLPEDIVMADLRWRWKKEKGLTYAEDFNTAERMIVDAISRDGPLPNVRMDDKVWEPKPGIFIPAGSWLQP